MTPFKKNVHKDCISLYSLSGRMWAFFSMLSKISFYTYYVKILNMKD